MSKEKIKFDTHVQFVHNMHWEQTRRSKGNLMVPYIIHPLDVMRQLCSWGLTDSKFEYLWIAALYHDVMEDCNYSEPHLRSIIGDQVYLIVEELTHDGDSATKDDYMASFGGKSIEALIIKLADRVCNIADTMVESQTKTSKLVIKSQPLWSAFSSRRDEIIKYAGESLVTEISSIITAYTYLTANANESEIRTGEASEPEFAAQVHKPRLSDNR